MGTEQDGMESVSAPPQHQGSESAAAGPECTSHVVLENVELSASEPMSVGEMPQCHDDASAYVRNPVTSVLVTPNSKPLEGKFYYITQPQDGATSPTQTGFNTDQDIQMEVAQSLTELSTVRTLPQTSMNVQQSPMIVHSPTLSKPGQQMSPGSQLFTVTRAQNGTISIHHDDNVTFQKGEEKLLKKIAKTAVHRPLKGDKDAASASLDSEILDVVIKYEEEESLKKITMRELRHIIPLLIMRCYNISEEPYQRKVRGMWTEKPENWPETVPYCDPNNKKESGKPKKDTLLYMFKHLRQFYTNNFRSIVMEYKQSKHGQVAYMTVVSEVPVIPSGMEALEAAPASPSMTAPHPAQPSTTLSYSHPITITSSTPGGGLMMEAPRSVSHPSNIKQEMDPEEQLFERIGGKLKQIEAIKEWVGCLDFLRALHDILGKIYLVRSQDHIFYLEVAHDFDLFLDVMMVTGTLPENYAEKWRAFYERNHVVPDPASTEQVQDTMELQEMQDIGREEEVATDNILIVNSNKDRESSEPQPYLTTNTTYPYSDIQEVLPTSQVMPQTSTPQITQQYRLKDYQPTEPNNVLETGQADTDCLAELVSTALFVDEDLVQTMPPTTTTTNVVPISQPISSSTQPPPRQMIASPLQSQAPPPQTEAPPPSQLQAEDISDVIFPLSSGTDLTEYYEQDSSNIFQYSLDTDCPSTKLVTVPSYQPSTASTTKMVEIPDFSKLKSKLKMPRPAPSTQNDRIKAMAAAFFNTQKNNTTTPKTDFIKKPTETVAPNIVLYTRTSESVAPVIPSVVEDLEKSLQEEESVPRKRMKRAMKRPLPATTLTTYASQMGFV